MCRQLGFQKRLFTDLHGRRINVNQYHFFVYTRHAQSLSFHFGNQLTHRFIDLLSLGFVWPLPHTVQVRSTFYSQLEQYLLVARSVIGSQKQVQVGEENSFVPQLLCARHENCGKSECSWSDGRENGRPRLRIDQIPIWMNAIQCHRDRREH
jgi:hypothetical protein